MMGLPNQTNVVDVSYHVIRLHPNYPTDSDLLLLPIWPPDEYVLFPSIGYPLHQLDDVAAASVKERQ